MIAILLLVAAASTHAKTEPNSPPGEIVGTLADIAQNQLDGRVAVSTLQNDGNLWALGMPHGLNRELLVEGGKITRGGFVDHRYVLDHPHDVEVAFLVHARVSSWIELPIPETVKTFAELERFILKVGIERGFDGEQPFPFRLSAKVKYLRWFVVGGMGNLRNDPRASFERSRVLGGLDNINIEALGFYSRRHRGIATNPRSDMHIHFRTIGNKPFVAHLDDEILLERGAKLLLPASVR